MEINAVTGAVINAALKVHTSLGPGLLERAYQLCLAHELRKQGLEVQCEVLINFLVHRLRDGIVRKVNHLR